MKTLKKTINQYMLRITGALMILILAIVICLELWIQQRREYESSVGVLAQIEQHMNNNLASENPTEEEKQSEFDQLLSLIRANSEANYYVISAEDGEVISTTDEEALGKTCEEIGFLVKEIKEDANGFYARINGERFYCVFQQIEDHYVGRCVDCCKIFQSVPDTALLLVVCLAVIAGILIISVSRYMNRYVVDEIHEINDELCKIAEGNLEVKVDACTSVEFSELSDYINTMVSSLSDSTSKISYVLSKTNMFIGVYEYRKGSKPVHCTEYIPRIFSLELDEWRLLTSDYELFQEFIEKVRLNPLEEEDGVFVLGEDPEQYLKLEEMEIGNEVFGVVIDVTEDILRRRKIEAERDVDLLTGLYNRRGLEANLSLLFREPEKLGFSALVMIDADGLKGINDNYGHEMGDVYLKKISSVINNFGIHSSLSSRQGGDEFVLFLYEYDSEDELLNTIKTLEYIQGNSSARLRDGLIVPMRFSFGYCLMEDGMTCEDMLKTADERMYENKRKRKEALAAEAERE